MMMATRKSLNGQSPLVNGSILTVEVPDSQAAPAKPSRARKVAPPVETPAPTKAASTERTRLRKEAREAEARAAADKLAAELAELAARRARDNERVWTRLRTVLSSVTPRQATAMVVGGFAVVANVILGLSLIHSAAAINDLTGQNPALGWLLAIGIDCGLMLTEVAEFLSRGKKWARIWSRGTLGVTAVLSVMLNTHNRWSEREDLRFVFGWTLGVVIPLLIFAYGRIAAYLLEEE